jgi:hypothetical protein
LRLQLRASHRGEDDWQLRGEIKPMPDDILNAMRGLREDMRQRLLQSSEYRALEALDAAIDEIGAILQTAPPVCASAPVASEIQVAPLQEAAQSAAAPPPSAPAVLMAPQTPAARHQAIADAFAETLAAKLDPRNGARAATAYQPASHTHFG